MWLTQLWIRSSLKIVYFAWKIDHLSQITNHPLDTTHIRVYSLTTSYKEGGGLNLPRFCHNFCHNISSHCYLKVSCGQPQNSTNISSFQFSDSEILMNHIIKYIMIQSYPYPRLCDCQGSLLYLLTFIAGLHLLIAPYTHDPNTHTHVPFNINQTGQPK